MRWPLSDQLTNCCLYSAVKTVSPGGWGRLRSVIERGDWQEDRYSKPGHLWQSISLPRTGYSKQSLPKQGVVLESTLLTARSSDCGGMHHTWELRGKVVCRDLLPFPQSYRSPLRQAPEIHSISTRTGIWRDTVKQQGLWLQRGKHTATAPAAGSEQCKGLWEGMLSTKSH